MSAADLPRLIADARLILEYAVRAGKLQDDALAKAIQGLEERDNPQCIIDLQNAMNGVVSLIAPMTLVDLRAGRNPFDQRNVHARSRWQIGLSLATLALIATIAYYQYLAQRQESALRAYKEVVAARGSERITDVRALVQQGHALTKQSCHREAYQKARHELRQLAERSLVASKTLLDLANESPWPAADSVMYTIGWIRGWHWLPEATAAAPPRTAFAAPAASSPTVDKTNFAKDPCEESGSSKSKLVPIGYPDWLRNVVLDTLDEFCFASRLSVDSLSVLDPIRRGTASPFGPDGASNDPVAKVEQRMRVQTGWLLPFLYGLLGACVYVMRRLLFDTKAAVVENVVIVLRLALGALAGVAIGWFAVPSSMSSAALGASSLPYVLAFLAGFSIDILFTMLDRVNRLLVDKAQSPRN